MVLIDFGYRGDEEMLQAMRRKLGKVKRPLIRFLPVPVTFQRIINDFFHGVTPHKFYNTKLRNPTPAETVRRQFVLRNPPSHVSIPPNRNGTMATVALVKNTAF